MNDKALRRAQQVLAANRQEALGFVQAQGERETRRLLEESARDLAQRVQAVESRGAGPDSYTAAQLRATLAQVRAVLKPLQERVRGLIVDKGQDAAESGAKGTVEYLAVADDAFRGVGTQPLALKTAKMLSAARGGSVASILRRLAGDEAHPGHPGVLQRYGIATIGYFERELQKGLIQRKSWKQMADSITEKSPFLQAAPEYWARRIVRTELMAAQNRGQHESILEMQRQVDDACKILSATFDDRTGADSYAVHGQIRRPEEPFEWWDGLYLHPPNRPNDREVVVPHRIAWPIPPYLEWKDARDIAMVWKREGRKGAPPARPTMTTIPLSQFGRASK